MERALTRYCNQLYNWFEVGRYVGLFEITNGRIDCPFLSSGQYFRVVGSLFNDGIHKYPVNDCIDESFEGVIFPLAVPLDFIKLVDEAESIDSFLAGYAENPTGFSSESFGGYSYTREADPYTAATNRREEIKRTMRYYRKVP